ncbi:MAG: HD domain-containing protein, partial [Candidatus Cloacimonetes bacterium]|nr:HD domain-containing protein [Candidatus Cloacimonadota bacterium]
MTISELRERLIPQLEGSSFAGNTYIVGGAVRDHLLGRKHIWDFDLTVELPNGGIKLGKWLRGHGDCLSDRVNKVFGTVRLDYDDFCLDLNGTRKEQYTKKAGYPVISYGNLLDDVMRRDFTINAIGEDFSGNICDPHGGIRDLRAGLLRAVGPGFAEDPLRVLRAVQFAARFDLKLDPGTSVLCKSLLPEFSTLPVERIWTEWEKWAALAQRPSAGLQVLLQTGWIEAFPEILAMVGLPQDPVWHPEGDVFTHTLHTCDAAAMLAAREHLDRPNRVLLLLASLAHDFGKATTTVRNAEGRWTSPRHDKEGVPL